jgi:hypothetical protein
MGAWDPEALSLLERAGTRLLGGWTQADRDALAKQDRDKEHAVWRLSDTARATSQGLP